MIQQHGNVWMLKTGKMIPDQKMASIILNNGFLALRAPKADGSKYYFASVIDAFNGPCKKDMIYPLYYEEMLNDEDMWAVDSLEGSWFKINKILEIQPQLVGNFYLVSNGKRVEDVLSSSRTSVTYVNCCETFNI